MTRHAESALSHLAKLALVAAAALAGVGLAAHAEDAPYVLHEPPAIVGRWDLTVHAPDGDYPSWLEISPSGYRTLVGAYVGRTGSVRPIGEVFYRGEGKFEFSLPPQWERTTANVEFKGTLAGEVLQGETVDERGRTLKWEGRRAPALPGVDHPEGGEIVELFNGKDLAGWKPRSPGAKHGWVVRDGVLVNETPGVDLVSERKFDDFEIHVEFRYPKGSNSGLYLRGRYEVQIEDNFGGEPDSHRIGGVYGFLKPKVNAAKPAGEWQTLDAALFGRRVTVMLNGQKVITDQEIPGITGGALDSAEGEPGPIMLQGDHGPVEFRSVRIGAVKRPSGDANK